MAGLARLCQDNPQALPKTVLASTQKLLDRVLFCAFAEDRGLLPVETIRKAYEHRDPYHPRPIYDNFRGLFRSINIRRLLRVGWPGNERSELNRLRRDWKTASTGPVPVAR